LDLESRQWKGLRGIYMKMQLKLIKEVDELENKIAANIIFAAILLKYDK